MAEPSLNWIIIRDLASVNFLFTENSTLFIHVLVKSLEGSSAISHTRLVRITLQDSRNTNFLSKTNLNKEITFLKKVKLKANNFFIHLVCFFIHILVKSLEGSSAISHTRAGLPSRFLEASFFKTRENQKDFLGQENHKSFLWKDAGKKFSNKLK